MATPGEAPAFPRGGRELISPGEKKRIRQEAFQEAQADYLAGDGSTNKYKKQKRGKKAEEADDVLAFVSHTSTSEKLKYVELLKFKALSVGAKVWGAVASIQARELSISLPDGLRAVVPAKEASDVIASMMREQEKAGKAEKSDLAVPSLQAVFHVGQLVCGVIIKLEEAPAGTKSSVRKRVVLSLRTEMVNKGISRISLLPGMCLPACVKDAEDHGYSLTMGIKGSSAFLEKAEAEKAAGSARLVPGSMLNVVITKTSDTRLLTVTVDPKLVTSSLTKEEFNLTLGTLQPGALVTAKVVKVLDDGLLLSFLIYFSGTVDSFHIPQMRGKKSDWKAEFSEGQKVKARILYVDQTTKKVCMSLLPHLVGLKTPELPAPGDLIKGARVARVDAGVGVILDLPTGVRAFCHISDVSDERVDKLEKVLKVGQTEDARVIGSRLMDSLAVVSLKPSAIEQYLVTGLQPGQIVKGEVVLVDEHGMLVSISKNTKAFVANEHISDLGEKQGKIKYKVGSKVTGRILKVDPVKRRTSMTLQKSLVASKTTPLVSLEDIPVGVKTHGLVNGFTSYGMFVHFYGDVRGLVHISEMNLEPGSQPSDLYTLGQVVKVKVLSFDPATRRIQLSMSRKGKSQASSIVKLAPGEVVSGTVTEVRQSEDGEAVSYRLDLDKAGQLVGRGVLEASHLADHPSAIEAFQESLQVGSRVEGVMVLDESKAMNLYPLTRKSSLVKAKDLLPQAIEDVQEGQILPGFVGNVTSDAVFVRFLAGFTGRAGAAHLSDAFVSDPSTVFTVGQSVAAQVLQVNKERGTFGLSLKCSAVGDSRATFLAGLFSDLDAAHVVKCSSEQGRGEATSDWSRFPIGDSVKASVHTLKDYGVICDLEDDPNLVGLVALHQMDEELKEGDDVEGRIIDCNKVNGLIDLTLRKELFAEKRSKKRKKSKKNAHPLPQVGQAVAGTIQIVREDYSVVVFPDLGNQIGFAGLLDFNLRQNPTKHALFSKSSFVISQHPSKESGGRLIVAYKDDLKKKNEKTKRVKLPRLTQGEIVEGEISEILPLSLLVTLKSGHTGTVHITQLTDGELPESNPLSKREVGEQVKAVVVGKADAKALKYKGSDLVELSLKPSVVQGTKRAGRYTPQKPPTMEPGTICPGYVAGVNPEYLLVTFAPSLTGRVSVLDVSSDPDQLTKLTNNFSVGQPCKCIVIKSDGKSWRLDLALAGTDAEGLVRSSKISEAQPGSQLMGRVVAVAGHGVRLRVGPNAFGNVSLLDTQDHWVDNALQDIRKGAFVRCHVLENPLFGVSVEEEESGSKRKRAAEDSSAQTPKSELLSLSLKPSLGAIVSGRKMEPEILQQEENPKLLSPGIEVCGYVKSASKAGVFVLLGAGVVARVKLMNLAHSFVEDPEASFPTGKFVKGRVVSTEPMLEVTLRTGAPPKATGFEGLEIGQIVRGKVVRVKDFGVFIQLDDRTAVGLVHKSEVSDEYVKDVAASGMFTRLQPVRALVLEVDAAAKKLKLSLKASNLEGIPEESDADVSEPEAAQPDLDDVMMDAMTDDSDSESDWRNAASNGVGIEEDPETAEVNYKLERASRKAQQQAALKEAEQASEESEEGTSSSDSDLEEEGATLTTAHASGTGGVGWGEVEDGPDTRMPTATVAGAENEKGTLNKRQLKKRKKEEEEAIRKAEMARLEGGAPKTAADFERELMGSPSKSLLWIQYMAFFVSMGEIAQARAVAEQALQRIAYREEEEKFNVWVAWLNLELQYGEPPEEAATKLFQRALTFTNQKKLYMALLNILEKADKEELLQQTYKAVHKKYAGSAKFWLHHLSHAQRQDDAAYVASVLERAVKNTPVRKHVKILRQSAIQEFKFGSAERGRSTFESLLRNYPKRMDLWSIYIDQEIKQGDKMRIRSLFSRATSLQIPAKKMKFLFKRQLEFEKEHGTAQTAADVKTAARKYVQENMHA